jgi:23S rRNA (adenine2503-C2)-methyltransferase
MSGCPVGCVFCGTGKWFVRNLSASEIIQQITHIIDGIDKDLDSKCKKLQIMFMSMGEPMLNWSEVYIAIVRLNILYPNAQLLISTMGIYDMETFDSLIRLSKKISKVGLQFSIHAATDEKRNKIIPYKNKWNLEQIRDAGIKWAFSTKRNVFLNYCVDENNCSDEEADQLMKLFSPSLFNFTFSVICSADETMKAAGERNLDVIRAFEKRFLSKGYNTRIFNPAGQDDIGGGCGQLWYVQQWMKEKGRKAQ